MTAPCPPAPRPRLPAAVLIVLAGAGGMHPSRAQTPPPGAWSAELASGRQQLSNQSPDWTETSVRLGYHPQRRQASEVGITHTERFGLSDDQLSVLAVRPLSERLVATVDASASPTHRVLARYHAGATVQYELAPSWLVHGGLRGTQYNSAAVTQGTAMLEHYFSSFSWLVAWRPVQTQGSSTSGTELRGSYYYADRSAISLSVASGQEAVQISDTQLQLADVRATTLTGRHGLGRDWALSYEWNSTRQGEFYTRTGWRFGVQHLF